MENEEKVEISANCKAFQEISSNFQDSSCGLLARGVGFEPTRPFLTTDLAGLPPTRLGQPRPVFGLLGRFFMLISVFSGIPCCLSGKRIRSRLIVISLCLLYCLWLAPNIHRRCSRGPSQRLFVLARAEEPKWQIFPEKL